MQMVNYKGKINLTTYSCKKVSEKELMNKTHRSIMTCQ